MKRKPKSKNGDYSLAHVLYQRLGNEWYAFTEIDGDCFMTKVDAETAQEAHANSENLKAKAQETRARRRAA